MFFYMGVEGDLSY